jgi:predicted membrane protein (TIGR00267 family)
VSIFRQALFLLHITHSEHIVRRYLVVNGFDGALTMLGLIIGFLISSPADLSIVINVCLGAGIALGMSGISSAYISEVAERKHALENLEKAMVTDLQDSAHGDAARWVPILIALVNGSAPFIISLLILTPLWLSESGISLPLSPILVAVGIALFLIFLLGVFLGRIADISWLRSGGQTLLIAIMTAILIFLLAGH